MTERHSMSGFWGEVPESQDSTIIYHSTVATCVDCHATFPFDENRRPTPRALDGRKRGAKSKSMNGKGGSKAARQ